MKRMASLLRDKESSYFTSLHNMFEDVREHLEEARDVAMHLRPLRPLFDDIEQTELSELEPKLSALFHMLCLIWAHSKYYRNPARLVVLLQEIVNFIIDIIKTFLDPESILKAEVDEAYDQIKIAQKVLSDFKRLYYEYKEKIPTYFKNGVEPKTWDYRPKLVFHRFDRFQQRIDIIADFFQSSIEMLNLEKVEIGGIRGASLSAQVVSLHEEFIELHKTMTEISYDCLQPEDYLFDGDYRRFKQRLLDMDRRLGSILCQAFDDCYGVEQMFKLIAIAGSLLERPIIKEEFEAKFGVLINQFSSELDTAKIIFDTQKDDPPLHKNQPLTAGRLKWANELLRRISDPRDKFNLLTNPIFETEDSKLIFSKYDQMVQLIADYKAEQYKLWTDRVDEDCRFNLSQPLLTRNAETKLIAVNFNPKLEAVLREVRYFGYIKENEIPPSAGALFERHDQLRLWVATLHQTVHWYNKIRKTVLDVEYPLVEKQLGDGLSAQWGTQLSCRA